MQIIWRCNNMADCSLFCIRYLPISSTQVVAVDVDGRASSGTFRFSTLMLCTLIMCSCSFFVEPPVIFSKVWHMLHLAV